MANTNPLDETVHVYDASGAALDASLSDGTAEIISKTGGVLYRFTLNTAASSGTITVTLPSATIISTDLWVESNDFYDYFPELLPAEESESVEEKISSEGSSGIGEETIEQPQTTTETEEGSLLDKILDALTFWNN